MMGVFTNGGNRCEGAIRSIAALPCFLIAMSVAVAQERSSAPTPSAPKAEVYFVDIKDGDKVSTKLKVHFGLKNMGVAPAGSDRPNSGHHLLAWYPWASLFLWTWATRGKLQQRLPERPVQRGPGTEQRGRITRTNVEPTQSHPLEAGSARVVHSFPR